MVDCSEAPVEELAAGLLHSEQGKILEQTDLEAFLAVVREALTENSPYSQIFQPASAGELALSANLAMGGGHGLFS